MDLSTGGADFTLRGDVRQHLGVSVAIGDFNGDHASDLFAGAPMATRPDRNELGGVSLAPRQFHRRCLLGAWAIPTRWHS
jgi:FG-GAP repeat